MIIYGATDLLSNPQLFVSAPRRPTPAPPPPPRRTEDRSIPQTGSIVADTRPRTIHRLECTHVVYTRCYSVAIGPESNNGRLRTIWLCSVTRKYVSGQFMRADRSILRPTVILLCILAHRKLARRARGGRTVIIASQTTDSGRAGRGGAWGSGRWLAVTLRVAASVSASFQFFFLWR